MLSLAAADTGQPTWSRIEARHPVQTRFLGSSKSLDSNTCAHLAPHAGCDSSSRPSRLRVRYADGEEEEWPITESEAQRWLRRPCARRPPQSCSFAFRRLVARPVWTAALCGPAVEALCAELESSHRLLRQEALAALRHSLFAEGPDDSDSGDEAAKWTCQKEGLHVGVWQKLELWHGAHKLESSCKMLPTFTTIVERFASAPAGSPIMLDAPGRVFLSLLLPGSHVKKHAGPTNHRLRLHLPLLLPMPPHLPWMAVAGQRCAWHLGRCLIFDDSFEHEVLFPAQADRIRAAPGFPMAAGGSHCAEDSCGQHARRKRARPDHGGDSKSGFRSDSSAEVGVLDTARLLLVLDLWHPQALSGPFPKESRTW